MSISLHSLLRPILKLFGLSRRTDSEIIAAAARDALGGERIAQRAIQGPEQRNSLERHFISSVGEIPGYTLTRLIYRGGQGMVFEGVQLSTGRCVAIKVMQLTPKGAEAELRAEKRFRREVQALADLNDPGIVSIYDSGVAGIHRYFIMEYVEGETLADRFANRVAEPQEAVRLIEAVARSLQAAHAKGIVHRDLKPSNIMVDRDGRVRILDFGLAKLNTLAQEERTADMASLSEEGQFYGTRAWASPEQIEGTARRITPRTDVYALGVVLYHLLTGRFPYSVDGPSSLISDNILNRPPEPMRRASRSVPRDIECIVQKCLRKTASDRYADAGELAADLRRHLDGRAVSARGDGWGYLAGLALRRAVRDGRVLAVPVTALLGVLIAFGLLATGWLWPIESFVNDRVHRARASWHPDVHVIALTDGSFERINELSERLGLVGVSSGNLYSWRQLHGELMRRLAAAAPRVVAWDIAFVARAPEHDHRFIEGMQVLQQAGTRVILGVPGIDEHYSPMVNREFQRVANDWGWLDGQVDRDSQLTGGVAVVDSHPAHPQHPALSLAAYRAFLGDPRDREVRWSPSERAVNLVRVHDGRPFVSESIPVFGVFQIDRPPTAARPFGDDRRMAYIGLALPDAALCQGHTTLYHDALELTDAELCRRFSGKLIVIGDCRFATTATPDMFLMRTSSSSRRDFGVYMHARAIGELLDKRSIARSELVGQLGFSAFAAVLGSAWIAATRGTTPRLLGGLVSGLALLLASIISLVVFRRLVQPSLLCAAFVIAGAAMLFLSKLMRQNIRGIHTPT